MRQPRKLFITFMLLTLVSFLTVSGGIQVSAAKTQHNFLQSLNDEIVKENGDEFQPNELQADDEELQADDSISAQKKDSNEVNLVVTERYANGNIPSGATGTITATCAKGEIVTGGGFDGTFNANQVISSHYSDNPNGWAVTFKNDGGPNQVAAYVECAHLE